MAQNKPKGSAKAVADAKEVENTSIIPQNFTESPSKAQPQPKPANLASLVSQYQTSMDIQNLLGISPSGTSSNQNEPNSAVHPEIIQDSPADTNTPPPDCQPHNAGSILDRFQASIEPASTQKTRTAAGRQSSAYKQAKFSKTSISSLINVDENASLTEVVQASPKSSEPTGKRKRASPKSETAPKKSKLDTPKKTSKVEDKAEAKAKAGEDAKLETVSEPSTSTTREKGAKGETKKAAKQESITIQKKTAKSTKKTPEVVLPSQDKPSIHPTMTTEKAKTNTLAASVPAPTFLSLEEQSRDLGLAGPGDEREKPSCPVIALDIPLLDPKNPKPGQAEVVVNVLRLAEEKYGWSAVHPEARSAFELMDDALDDDEDADEDEEDEDVIVQDKSGSAKKKEDAPEKKKRKQSQQTKMNRKVGKYDYEDPFIDDEELQWEEEITTTREGFFVYWGPLVDERQQQRRTHGKSKK